MRRVPFILATLVVLSPLAAHGQKKSIALEHRPADQRALLALFNDGDKEIKAAQNEILKSRAEKAWETKWCAATKKLKKFDGWTGTIHDIRWNGYFSVEISSMPDDRGILKLYDLDIKEGTAMFEVISKLKEGMSGTTSGYFIEPEVFCFDGAHLSVQDFHVRFSKVAPLF
jgi:hypothetical protein